MEIPNALVKDLRSTGYFYDELKNYSQSPVIDIRDYCANLAVPYLDRVTGIYDSSGQSNRSGILKLAMEHLSISSDLEIVDSIFGLKKVAESEIAKASKADLEEQPDKSKSLANRQRLESAEFLVKLLVSIIKIFKLVRPNANQKTTDGVHNPVFEAITQRWEALEGLPAGKSQP